jgi:cytochrome oxidase Cu insertion factor (SCO1/SenC/PrrC family)
VGRAALTVAGLVLLASTWPATPAASAGDPFEAMNALRPSAPVPAPDVVFRTLDGRPARTGDFRGQPVVLTFFTTW